MGENKRQSFAGDYEEMIKFRRKQKKEIMAGLEEVLDGYDGGMIAIVRVTEDENGDITGSKNFLAGVSKREARKAIKEGFANLTREIDAGGNDEVDEAVAEFKDLIKKLLED